MAKNTQTTPNKQHGGHNRGKLSDKAKGSGPVYQIRTEANLTQKALGDIIECSWLTLSRAEKAGAWPKDARILRNLKKFAAKKKITVEDPATTGAK